MTNSSHIHFIGRGKYHQFLGKRKVNIRDNQMLYPLLLLPSSNEVIHGSGICLKPSSSIIDMDDDDDNNNNNNNNNSDYHHCKELNVEYAKLINRSRRVRKGKLLSPEVNKRCGWCQTIRTPLWRTGPNNILLCNACGLQFHNQKRAEQSKRKLSISSLLN